MALRSTQPLTERVEGKSKGKTINTNKMGRACSAYGEGYRCAQGVGGEA